MNATRIHHRRPHDVRINLSSNELLHPELIPLLRRALAETAAETLTCYPDYHLALRSLAPLVGRPEEEMLLVPGTDAAIRTIVRSFASSATGSGAPTLLLQHPNYYGWEQAAASAGVRLVRIPWGSPEDQGPAMLEAAGQHEPALVAISFPNGPIGGLMTLEEVDTLVDLCAERGHRLVVDVCYAVFDRMLPPLAGRWNGHVSVVQSLSKSHALAGCRIGLAMGSPTFVARLANERLEHCVSAPAIAMAIRITLCHSALEAIWNDVARERNRLTRALDALGFDPIPSGGNFVTFRAASSEQAARLAQEMSLRGYRLKTFEGLAGFNDCLRMTVTHSTVMGAALTALARALVEG